MSVMLLVMSLWLLLQGCACDPVNLGCMEWDHVGDGACCKACHPGHRLVRKCGPRAIDLCTPCEPGTYASTFSDNQCKWCTQCAGTQVQLEACTPTADTKCGCKKGYTCGNDHCSFCVRTCTKGQEPHDGSCRPCPNGTFNDKIHQKCKPWSTECPKPNQRIAAKGDAFTDIKCVDVSKLNSVVTTPLSVDTSDPKTVTTTETPVSDPKTVVKVEPPGEDIKVFCLCLCPRIQTFLEAQLTSFVVLNR
uniref:Tumor necrosis factor receptor superfamily, member 9a n=1 Tax=Salarias fasciatus TaxID=181472 RepID=A0A672JCK0_SALFA